MTAIPALRRRQWRRGVAAFVAAWLFAAAWGSVVQTQFNLQALAALDVWIPAGIRALTTVQDLVGFGPAYAGIVLAAWLCAVPVAALLARAMPRWRIALYALATGMGSVVAIRLVDMAAPMPVLIDATRSGSGLLAMTLGSLLGGALFGWWTRASRCTR